MIFFNSLHPPKTTFSPFNWPDCETFLQFYANYLRSYYFDSEDASSITDKVCAAEIGNDK